MSPTLITTRTATPTTLGRFIAATTATEVTMMIALPRRLVSHRIPSRVSEVRGTLFGSHASPGGGSLSGRLGTAQAGATAGSLWQLEQTVASSGSSSAQCGQTFTSSLSGPGHRRYSPWGPVLRSCQALHRVAERSGMQLGIDVGQFFHGLLREVADHPPRRYREAPRREQATRPSARRRVLVPPSCRRGFSRPAVGSARGSSVGKTWRAAMPWR